LRLARQSAEVDRITGVRLVPLEGQKAMRVEYRIKWKDDAPESWCALRGGASARRKPHACAARGRADAVLHAAGSRCATWQRMC
jgi:hypothetical protein